MTQHTASVFEEEIMHFLNEAVNDPLALEHFHLAQKVSVLWEKDPSAFRGHFTFLGFRFSAEVIVTDNQKKLHIESLLGKVPFSYESIAKRVHMLAVLFTHRHLSAPCLAVDEKGKVQFDIIQPIHAPIDPKNFLVAVLKVLSTYMPILHLIRAVAV